MYTVHSENNYFFIKKDDIPLSLVGVGLLRFDDKEDAERYIRGVYEAAYYIRMGVPE